MSEFIPAFDWTRVMVEPWTVNLPVTLWIALMGFLITAACGLIGNYLILRRMALVGSFRQKRPRCRGYRSKASKKSASAVTSGIPFSYLER